VFIPEPGTAIFDLKIQQEEKSNVDAWFDSQKNGNDNRTLVAFAPGSKMQSKRWSLVKFAQVGKKLVSKYDVMPIVFGGPEDVELGQTLIKSWGCGYNAAGALNVREAAEALRRCAFYVGNDTGTMHLAASMGTPCAALFSARDNEGKWHPYGEGHLVFRERINCQGCMLEYCDHKSCLERIGPLTVFRSIEKQFAELLKSSQNA
jgi:ADP-heptose:LPS heptosyltransferase